jgi:hypothetical protein
MNKSTVLLASTTVAFGISSIYLVQMLRAEHDRTGALQARITELEYAERSVSSSMAHEESRGAVVSTPQPSESQPSASKTAVSRPGKDAGAFSKRLTNPTYHAAELAYLRLEVERQYPDLATALNLSPDEANRLLDLLTRQAMSQREYEMKLQEQGGLPDQAAVRARQKQNEERQRTVEAERAALLGEAKQQELNQYLESLGARAQIRELRTMLAESDFPLRRDQVAPLVESLAAEQKRHTAERESLYNSTRSPTNATPEEVIRHMGQRLDLIEQSLQRRRKAASLYLDSEQQKRYDEMLARERQRAQIDYDLFVTLNKETPRGN